MSAHDSGQRVALEILVFEVASGRFALRVGEVREVLRAAELAAAPDALGRLDGLLNLRGNVVPVFNIRAYLGLPAAPVDHSDQFIVCQAGERRLALRSERAIELKQVAAEDLEPPPDVLAHSGVVSAVVKDASGLVYLLDPSRFVSPARDSSGGEKKP